ncbi:MAG: hypothetical protein A3A33_02245 [Candidatus Yanofskybacteria bacterium RIFCSPLOWO2_01_FULL_49_25]|uniref:VTT domain-containing protein n=1 Tax=Candidatus Yanofskybacteria bacterium RIFCSPLOWO2_01_FULL_49_25 TaxID=1802701 RepID=A0A1F8GRV3_9BACT|nr:MAG: hypothetical protein A3A33_02245 [Candidatus Yanofskybacteria bacterium RIFCSPLOWO2_01_FULL_49_25]
MDIATFSGAFEWVIAHGYFLMFLAMLIEGPIVTAAAAFASALGYFDPILVFILSILGDLVADVIYYAIGYWGRLALVERWGHRFGLSQERMERIERLLNKHAVKTLIALKLTPILPTPGLMIVGATRMPLSRYASISLLITLPKSLLFMIIGYYFGRSYDTIARYLHGGEYAILALIIVLILAYYAHKIIVTKFSQRIEKL